MPQKLSTGAKESAIEYVRNNWIEKEQLFGEQTDALSMVQVDHFSADDPRGALLLTYSASLLVLGPRDPSSGVRHFEYASIKTRTDVPELLTGEAVQMSADVRIDQPASFSGIAIQRSSEILHIATFSETTSVSEQMERLPQAVVFLTNGFVHANRTLTGNPGDQPDQFGIRSTVAC